MRHILILLLMSTTIGMYAQNPIQVTPLVFPPYPSAFSDYLNQRGQPLLTLTNVDPNQFPYEIKLGLEVVGNNGITLNTDFEKQPLQPFLLLPGQSLTLTADDILDNYVTHNQDDINITGIDVATALQSQTIPEGVYQACVTAYDFYTNEPLSAPGCTPMIPINVLDPPIITTPTENAEIPFSDNPIIDFQWTPIVGAQSNISYQFEIAVLREGINPYDLFDSPNNIFLTTEVATPFFNYDAAFPPLEAGQQYAVRVRAFDANGITVIGNDGYSDVVTFTYGLPILPVPDWVTPSEGVSISINDRDFIDFAWERNYAANTATNYNFLLLEYPLDSDLDEVIANPQQYAAGIAYGIEGQSYRHNLLDLPLTGERYVAWFIAYSPDNLFRFENDGYSRPLTFYTSKVNSVDNGGFLPLEVAPAECVSCVRRRATIQRLKNDLVNGDTIRAGNFLVKLTDVNRNGSSYSGSGTSIPYGEMPAILFDFNNIRVNRLGEMLSGKLNARRATSSQIPTDWYEVNNAFRQYSDQQLYNARQFLNRLPQSPQYATVPFNLNSGVVVTALELTSEQAKGKIVHLKKMYGALPGASSELLFGLANHCFNNGGPASQGLQVRIPLLKRVNYKRVEDYEIHLLTRTDESRFGTHITYSCEQGIAYHLYGGVKFGLSSRLNFPQNGQQELAAFFNAPVDNINNFIINLDLGSQVRRELIGGNINAKFEHPELPGMQLRVLDRNIMLDHSLSSNPNNLSLPIGASTRSRRWRGLLLSMVNITLPSAFSYKSGSPVNRTVENMILDANGFSINTMFNLGQIERPQIPALPGQPNLNLGTNWNTSLSNINNLLNADQEDSDNNENRAYNTINMGGWNAGISDFQLAIEADVFQSAVLEGGIQPHFFDKGVPYNSRFYLNESRNGFNFSADIEAANTTVKIPGWKASITLLNDGELQMRTINDQLEVNLIVSGDLAFDIYPERKIKVDFKDIRVNDLSIANKKTVFGQYRPLVQAGSFEIGAHDYAINNKSVELLGVSLNEAPSVAGKDQHQLNFNYAINLGQGEGNQPAIGIQTDLTYFSSQISQDTQGFQLDSTMIAPIRMPEEIMPSYADNLDGDLVYAPIDRSGNWGFKSKRLQGEFGVFTGGAVALDAIFGTTSTGKPFWSLQADVDLGIARVPFMSGLYLGGLGGGLYSNMEKNVDNSNSGYRNYTLSPLRSGFSLGISANCSWETEDPQFLNGRFGVEADFINGGLSSVQFNGIAHFMDKTNPGAYWTTNTEPKENSWITVWGAVDFNISDLVINGNLGYNVNIVNTNWSLTGRQNRAVSFNISPGELSLCLGRPQSSTRPFGSKNVNLDFNAYMSIGKKRVSLGRSSYRGFYCLGNNLPSGCQISSGLALGEKITISFRTPTFRVYPWRDRARAGINTWASFNGSIGMYNSFCGRPGPRFGFRFDAEVGINGYVDYLDVCDMPFEKKCGRWKKYSAGLSAQAGLYGPSPMGASFNFDLGLWDWKGYLGQKCGR